MGIAELYNAFATFGEKYAIICELFVETKLKVD